uniref:Nuclear receptor corepressor 1 n=1 Tax=Macaca mulatta TaxID=9544 RepID=A0A5F7ZH70_MACMU
MSSSGYPPNQGAFSTEQSRYPPHSVQYTFPSTRHQQEFAVPDYRSSHLEVSQASQLLQQQQQQQLRRRPSLLSEFHPGSDRTVYRKPYPVFPFAEKMNTCQKKWEQSRRTYPDYPTPRERLPQCT